jgi:hypothetical protein
MRRRLAGLLPLLLLGACAGPAARSVTALPERPGDAVTDPAHQAVFRAAYAFGDTSRLAGRPADAARAVADVEWLAVALPQDQRWIGASPLLFGRLEAARAELRGVLGIAPDAAPSAVTQRLFSAAAALDQGRRAEAAAALGGEDRLALLGALPPLPRTAFATHSAQAELGRLMSDDPQNGE